MALPRHEARCVIVADEPSSKDAPRTAHRPIRDTGVRELAG
jgi:hypothetical protein